MKKIISVSLFAFIAWTSAAQQLTARQVINNSRKFYSSQAAGYFEVSEKFKSAIAFDTFVAVWKGFYRFTSKKPSIHFFIEGKEHVIRDNSVWYIMQPQEKTYSLVPDKEVKFISAYHKQSNYPFVYTDDFFLKEFTKTYEIADADSMWMLHDKMDTAFFAKSDFRLKKFIKQVALKEYGIQYKEVDIIYQDFNNAYLDEAYYDAGSLLKDYIEKKYAARSHTEKGPLNKHDIGKAFPPFSVVGMSGMRYSADALKGKYVLLDMFYQSCMPCVKSIPVLNELKNSLPADRFLVLGVDPILRDTANMDKFMAHYKMEYDVITGEDAKKLWEGVRNTGYPTYVLIDPEGNVSLVNMGLSKSFPGEVRKKVQSYESKKAF